MNVSKSEFRAIMSAVQKALSITQLLAMTSIQMDEKESNSTLRLVFVVG